MANFSDLVVAKLFDFFFFVIGWSLMAVSGLFIPAGVSTRLFHSPRSNLLCYFDVSTNDLHSSPHIP